MEISQSKGGDHMKYLALLVTLLAGFMLFVLAVNGTRANAQNPGDEESRLQKGFAIAPVPLDLHGKNRALVGLGSYIVNAQGTCNFCHTCPSFAPGHNPYNGIGDGQVNATNYLAGGLSFKNFGVVSANITPDSSGLPAGLTLQQFLQTLRTGNVPHMPSQKLLGMPWPIFRFMTDRDTHAVYEYLSSIPHAEPGACTIAGE
jgi:hypothetical protein